MKSRSIICILLAFSSASNAAPEYKESWSYGKFYEAVSACRYSLITLTAQDYYKVGSNKGGSSEDIRRFLISATPVFEQFASSACYCAVNEQAKDVAYTTSEEIMSGSAKYLDVPKCKAILAESSKILVDKKIANEIVLE